MQSYTHPIAEVSCTAVPAPQRLSMEDFSNQFNDLRTSDPEVSGFEDEGAEPQVSLLSLDISIATYCVRDLPLFQPLSTHSRTFLLTRTLTSLHS
jgi:hypothetical protein